MGRVNLFGTKKKAEPLAPTKGKWALRIAGRILSIQRCLAARLNAGAVKMGLAATLMLIVALLIGLAIYCSCLVLGAVF